MTHNHCLYIICAPMPLHLITGPLNSGKTTRLMGVLRDELKTGPAFYVVPNESIAQELRSAFLTENQAPPAVMGEIFFSYPSFIRKLARAREAVITQQESALLCMRILSAQRLKYFRKGRISFGIAREAAGTIAALKRNFVNPEILSSMLETRGTLKEYDLLTLFRTYETEKSRLGALDGADLYAMAAKKIESGGMEALKGARLIIFDEFFAPEPGLLEIVKLIRTSLPDAAISFALPEASHPSELFASRAAEDIRRILDISDRHEKLQSAVVNEPTVSVLKIRSPIEEIRFLIEESIGREGDEHVDTILCTRRGSGQGMSYLSELWRRDRACSLPRYPSPAGAPIIVEILDGPISNALPRSAPIYKFAETVMKEMRKMGDFGKWKKSLSVADERTEAARTFSAITAIERVLHAAASSARFLNAGEVSREAFLELAWEALFGETRMDETEGGILPARMRTFEHGISRPVEKIMIPGMTDGRFPAISDERLFFTEQEELGVKPNRLLEEIFPSPEVLLAREAFLFLTWISKARNEAILTLPAVDEQGSETIPSSFLDPFGKPAVVEAGIPEPIAVLDPYFEKRICSRLKIEEARLAKTAVNGEYNGMITDEKARGMIERRYANAIYSASQLEQYAECPFNFFMERVLSLKAPEDITREIQPKDRGTIIHTILEHFYRDHISVFRAAATDKSSENEIIKTIDALCESAFKKHAGLIAESSPVLHPFQKNAIRTVVLRVIMKEIADAVSLPSPLFPKFCEWIFGGTEKSALKIKSGDGATMRIQGRVDRVDVTDDGRFFAVTDYKSGRKIDSIRKDLEEGKHLQLPIYVKAVGELLLKDSVPLGGFLLAVLKAEKKHGFLKKEYNDVSFSVGKRTASLIDEDKWETLLESAIAHAVKYADEIRGGNFAPTNDACPIYCKYGDVCRKAKT